MSDFCLPTLSRLLPVHAVRVAALLLLVGFLLMLVAPSWAHGGLHSFASRGEASASPAAQSLHGTDALHTKQTLSEQAQESGKARSPLTHPHSSCVDCHMCCALPFTLAIWPMCFVLSYPQPRYWGKGWPASPLAPELRPPIHA